MDMGSTILKLKNDHHRAVRCWKANNIKTCLIICEDLSKRLIKISPATKTDSLPRDLIQIKHLVWFLKLKCLADDYYINESLLLNDEDVEPEDQQVKIFSGIRQSTARSNDDQNRKSTSNSGKMGTRPKTGIITGRMSSLASRQGGSRTISSYRPLTTSLTVTQTAFSKTTRPLLKYSTCNMLSKPVFEYLYNAQVVTNKCPDYRQCLEYLNLVQKTVRKDRSLRRTAKSIDRHKSLTKLLSTSDDTNDHKSLGVFWLNFFGRCYFNLRMNKQAEEYFKLAQTINSRYMDPYPWLIKIYLRFGQPIEVMQICGLGLKNSENAILYNWMARVQSLQNEPYAANLSLRASLEYYPNNAEALANVGHFSFYTDRLEQSLKCFERIQQLTSNQTTGDKNDNIRGSSAELLNNLALCNLYCGFHHKVMPLFLKAFRVSPGNEVTSDIWYNISFIPISLGCLNLAIACLRLALKNNSQNEEALNNIGALKCRDLIDRTIHFENVQELWPAAYQRNSVPTEVELQNHEDSSRHQAAFDEAETYFGEQVDSNLDVPIQPEMLHNLALVKRYRGQLSASIRFGTMYLTHDPSNHHMRKLLSEIKHIVSLNG